MRHLALIAALAPTLACRDAAEPAGTGVPALSSESSDRAILDLRTERASLITAGNALSDAVAGQGVLAAFGAALTDDALFLSPRVNTLDGRTAATTFLSTNPLAPSALHWEVFAADVANDGAQGFTWAQGTSTIDLGTGPVERATYYLTYWRRDAPTGGWRRSS